jgi:uncharacterized protein (TIGR02145 family)
LNITLEPILFNLRFPPMKKILLPILLMSFLASCELTIQKDVTTDYLVNGMVNGTLDPYLSHNQVLRYKGKPGVVTIPVGLSNLSEYERCFVLYVSSGSDPSTAASSASVKLDGITVLAPIDFNNKPVLAKFEICDLTPQSTLEIEVKGTPGSFVEVWIEGKLKVETVTDCDGNIYETIKIGDQIWMAENLKTTQYSDHTSIPPVDPSIWNVTTDGYYAWYNYDPDFKDRFGGFYNWYAVNSGKLCPSGWHVPSDVEWHTLTLNIDQNAISEPTNGTETTLGNVLKEAGTTNWYTDLGTNETGFTARGAGIYMGGFGGVYTGTAWWSSTLNINTDVPWYRNLGDVNGSFAGLSAAPVTKAFGFSVRCLKD